MDDSAMKQLNRLAFENGMMRHLLGEAVSLMSQFDRHLTMRQHEAWGMDRIGLLSERIREVLGAEETNATERESSALPAGRPKGNVTAASTVPVAPSAFPRANPDELEAFDPSTKECTMNCGPHRDDPRSAKERKLLCGDCLVKKS